MAAKRVIERPGVISSTDDVPAALIEPSYASADEASTSCRDRRNEGVWDALPGEVLEQIQSSRIEPLQVVGGRRMFRAREDSDETPQQ